MNNQQKKRKGLTATYTAGKRKVKHLETFYLQGGVWYNTRTSKPEKLTKVGGKKNV